jgi:hypothetical protein
VRPSTGIARLTGAEKNRQASIGQAPTGLNCFDQETTEIMEKVIAATQHNECKDLGTPKAYRNLTLTLLDKIFSELGEKILTVIRPPIYSFQTSSQKIH